MAKQNSTKLTLTYGEYNSIRDVVHPIKMGQNGPYRSQSDLSKAKGKVGVAVYYLLADLKTAFEPLNDRAEALKEEYKNSLGTDSEEFARLHKIEKRSAKEEKQYQELKEKVEEANKKLSDELVELNKETTEIVLRKGKLGEAALELLSADEMEVLEKVLDL